MRVISAQTSDEPHITAESGHVIRAGERATGETLPAQRPCAYNDIVLGRFTKPLAIMVFINNGVANHKDFELIKFFKI